MSVSYDHKKTTLCSTIINVTIPNFPCSFSKELVLFILRYKCIVVVVKSKNNCDINKMHILII